MNKHSTLERERESYLLIEFDWTEGPPVMLATDSATLALNVLNFGSLSSGMAIFTSSVFLNVG